MGLFWAEVAALDKSQKVSPKSDSERPRRVIKRYSNRKLYDTRDSRYVTLLQIAEMIRAGEDVQIIDNASKEDKTEVTLALIISEELKAQPRSVPLVTLRNLIHQRGEKLLSQLRDGPIGRLIPGAGEAPQTGPLPEGVDATPEEDPLGRIKAELERLSVRVAALEARLSGRSGPEDPDGGSQRE
jgi:polyhydroxyalkanoate synthesis repressor PhaR